MKKFNHTILNEDLTGLEINEGESGFYSKRYTHMEDGLNFAYSYYVDIVNLEEACGDNGYLVALYLVVENESMHDDVKDLILDGEVFELNHLDKVTHGYGALHLTSDRVYVDSSEIDNYGKMVLGYAHYLDSIRGFYLDRPINYLGVTGWDVVKHAVYAIEFR